VVYVSVSKAACTSIKWLLAEVQEESPERFYTALTREVSRPMTIHWRPLWQHTPMLHELSDDELEPISPDEGWFLFTVVRHPSPRLWSSWQSKLLLREPRWVEKFGDAPWFPRIPRTTQDVVDDFRRFAHAVAEDPDQTIMRDRHFRPQNQLATPERTPYTRIYDLSAMPELLEDLARHLRGRGWDGSLELRGANETPLRPLASMFTPDVTAAIGKVYAEDFERFGYENVPPNQLEVSDDYGEPALREIARLVDRGERIGDLALSAQRLKRARRADREKIKKLKRKVARLQASRRRNGALARKAKRRISSVLKGNRGARHEHSETDSADQPHALR
jgi:hypothetical protein